MFWKHRPYNPWRIKRHFCYSHLSHCLLILNIFSILRFEILTLRFSRCLTCLKQDALYGLRNAAIHTSAWQIWQVWFLFFWFYFIIKLLSCCISKIYKPVLLEFIWQIFFLLIILRLGLFGSAHGSGAKMSTHLPKICSTYPTMMKISTVIAYLTKIQNI